MVFDFLLAKCLVPGKTSWDERGRSKVNVKPQPGESWLVFDVDNDEVRKHLGIVRARDAMFFFAKAGESPRIIFVELKGSDLASAVDQLGQTMTATRQQLVEMKNLYQIQAVVHLTGGSPTETKKLQGEFQKKHRIPLIVTRDSDLRRCLALK